MRRALVAVILAIALVLAGLGFGAFSFVTQKARENLSNAGFDRVYAQTPWTLGLPHENVTFGSDVRLAGWWIPAPENATSARAGTTVILVHGLDSDMGHALERWGPNLHAAGFSLLALDLRNHGASANGPEGYVTYGASEAEDVLAAMRYVQADERNASAGRVALFGGSMGAATVLRAAALRPDGLAAVIADAPYASLGFQARLDGAEQGYPRFLADLVVWRMRSLAPMDPDLAAPRATIGEVAVPLLLSHCANDTRVEVASFHALAPLAPEGTVTWSEPCPGGADDDHHLANWKMPQYNATVVAFLDRAAPQDG